LLIIIIIISLDYSSIKVTNVEVFSIRTMMTEDNSCQTTTDLQIVQPSHNHFSSYWM